MKPSNSFFVLSVAAVTLLTLGATTAAQAPEAPVNPAAAAPPAAERIYPAPINLQVLPKTLSGKEVHEMMEQWAGALGTHCDFCHTRDANNLGPNGRPQLKFADDSKPMKESARIMFRMTERINADYVAKVDAAGMPVVCGTCHRGHLEPEPFVLAPEGRPSAPVPAAGEAPLRQSGGR